MLPGADAKLKSEAVLYTAHYDHFGIRPEMAGDNIYNGANDNATGCGVLLELARAFSQSAENLAARSSSLPSLPKNRGCWDRNSSASIRRFPAGKITLDLNYDDVTAAWLA